MWSSDFRHIGYRGEGGRADSLFRAAASAFCSLTRPTRRDAAQLEDLALPLFDSVSIDSRRYVAAALSECASAPNALVRRLCDEAVEVAAPLLVRSAALSDIDLIALIGRHGMPHARAIARRPGLNKTIADLIRALEGPRLVANVAEPAVAAGPIEPDLRQPRADAAPAAAPSGIESTRDRLRSMMRPAGQEPDLRQSVVGPSSYRSLLDTALSSNAAFFHTALADALRLDFDTGRRIAEADGDLLMGLRALDLGPEKAFLIVAATHPAGFTKPDAIRSFVERYRITNRDAVLGWLSGLRQTEVAPEQAMPANQDRRHAEANGKLKAS